MYSTYMDIINELDQRRIPLAKHDLDTKNVAKAAKERKEAVWTLSHTCRRSLVMFDDG